MFRNKNEIGEGGSNIGKPLSPPEDRTCTEEKNNRKSQKDEIEGRIWGRNGVRWRWVVDSCANSIAKQAVADRRPPCENMMARLMMGVAGSRNISPEAIF
ncbi:hypothetical protein L2E82_45526 [Cichorium intybus]|uniref:Uncharacterized protein n=1 Tax=Cichorium intybus TaxID=13427 RepID=A0ACB8ZXM6_CICIN|nr:hypothetical protein L2E82_45526 [Cichorium intybus]